VLKRKSGFQRVALLSFGFLGSFAVNAATLHKAIVTNIVDGDTAHVVTEDGKKSKVRYLGIDSPEIHYQNKAQSPWGQKASEHLHQMMNAQPAKIARGGRLVNNAVDRTTQKPIQAEVEFIGVEDSHNRPLGYIYYKGINTNVQMVKDGWAVPYLYCSKDVCNKDWTKEAKVSEFVTACKEAQKNKVGIYDPKNPLDQTPDAFRRDVDGRKPYQFIGNYETKKLYKPEEGVDFESEIPASRPTVPWCVRIRFDKESDAKALGYDY
jgi:micrococcal nuclease